MTGENWTVVVPVKPFSRGKSRLAPEVAAHRAALARCFYLDTLDAVLGTTAVSKVIVVTGDADAAALALARQAMVEHDDSGRGLNHAVTLGVAAARSLDADSAVAVVTADLPCLRADELGRVLSASHGHGRAFLADHLGMGTTVLTAGSGYELRPAYEGQSRRRHLGDGAVELRLDGVPGARLDVDTVEDLRVAAALGVGPFTARLLAGISDWQRRTTATRASRLWLTACETATRKNRKYH